MRDSDRDVEANDEEANDEEEIQDKTAVLATL